MFSHFWELQKNKHGSRAGIDKPKSVIIVRFVWKVCSEKVVRKTTKFELKLGVVPLQTSALCFFTGAPSRWDNWRMELFSLLCYFKSKLKTLHRRIFTSKKKFQDHFLLMNQPDLRPGTEDFPGRLGGEVRDRPVWDHGVAEPFRLEKPFRIIKPEPLPPPAHHSRRAKPQITCHQLWSTLFQVVSPLCLLFLPRDPWKLNTAPIPARVTQRSIIPRRNGNKSFQL